MNTLKSKRILLGITGSIAAYKSTILINQLRKLDTEVRVVMTENAKQFITPLTLQTLSNNIVYDDLFCRLHKMHVEHIELARWADGILIAPATANIIAKLAHGVADDLLSTICLTTTSKIVVVPAMNGNMWKNLVTQQNVQTLKQRHILFLGPARGHQACGDVDIGRMIEPYEIIQQLNNLFRSNVLSGKHVLITAGSTREMIDPVRYISNLSSGKMGFALAQAAACAGAAVTLVSGPVNLETPDRVNRINVMTAEEMYQAVMHEANKTDVFIAAAAVSDYRPKEIQSEKIKRQNDHLTLQLMKNHDILSAVANLKKRPYIVGFAAESEHLIENAKQKLKNKKLDMIAANLINMPGQGFESDKNALTVLWQNKKIEMPLNTKNKLARDLIQLIAKQVCHEKSTIENFE